ncbi:hypothetical protein QYF68_33080 [Mycolicibacterium austroafricanum]|uniref:Uncharacterized protein n=1 Tax=Mycolicibacterium austroafricanum TaxID=39687 RepID=A0ABT8HPD1_MYCAO|nr:hypothetical protein [Mycolicibacterium austroafricanum]MDN4522623.1 hypothetical protein [Mycolicibacterium austroafricanum]
MVDVVAILVWGRSCEEPVGVVSGDAFPLHAGDAEVGAIDESVGQRVGHLAQVGFHTRQNPARRVVRVGGHQQAGAGSTDNADRPATSVERITALGLVQVAQQEHCAVIALCCCGQGR